MSARNRLYREPDWEHVCDWTQEQVDAEEQVAHNQASRNAERRMSGTHLADTDETTVNYKEKQMSTKQAMKAADIAKMSDSDRSKALTVERAAVRRAKDAGKPKPPTPVIDWVNAHPDQHKTAGRKASAARVGAGPRLPEAERVKLFDAAIKAGANTMSGVKKHIRSQGKPCSGKWIRPLLADAAKKGLLKETVRKAPAKRAVASRTAPAKKAAGRATSARKRATPAELSKAHQTRGKGGKKAGTVAAHRRPTTRVTKRTPRRRAA